jgi:hypothetical protein
VPYRIKVTFNNPVSPTLKQPKGPLHTALIVICGQKVVIRARWHGAKVMQCNVWLYGKEIYGGTGYARGYNYNKEIASFDTALRMRG